MIRREKVKYGRERIKYLINQVGNQKKLADICNVSQQAVSLWLKEGRLRVNRIEAIEKNLSDKIDKNIIRSLVPEFEYLNRNSKEKKQ